MRHAVFGRKLARDVDHRRALRRNIVQSLIEHGEIRTTVVKAKEFRRFAERIVHLAVKAADATAANEPLKALALRQQAEALLTDRSIVPAEHRKTYDAMSDAKRAKTLRARSGRRYRTGAARPGQEFTGASVLHTLFAEIGPRMKRRADRVGTRGGYTRVIKLADRRLGDAGQLAILQLVGENDPARQQNKARSERRRKAKVRYTVYAGKPREAGSRRKSTAKKGAKADSAASSTPAAE
jgi:large subunit ribosomal protein L17